MFSKREAGGLAGALVLHAAAFLWFGRDRARPVDVGATEIASLEVEVEAPTVEAPPPEARPEPDGTQAPTQPSESTLRTVARAAHPVGDGNATAEGTPAPSSSATDFTFNPSGSQPLAGLSNEALGLGGRNRFLGQALATGADRAGARGAENPEVTNVAPGVDQSMRDVLDAHDRELGLDDGGPIVSVAEELTRPSDAPMNGRAVFEVVIDANGDIAGVRVLDAGDARASWERVAAQMGATLQSRHIAWRHKGHAMAVRVEVSSRWVLPSGQASPISGAFAQPGSHGTDMVTGVHFDVSDIGAHPSRDVHARVVGEKRL
ncbi:MAG TPA: hypothetical protein VH044_19765 [Polyangiaceae bacterium]|jgi:hypothetical protein|nr:hypothetical protein [Polyangiaceae bacterium]